MDAVGLVCSNVEASLSFYKNFGLEFKEYGEGHYEALLESGMRLMLDSKELMLKLDPNWKESINNRIVLCFKRGTSQLVDDLYNKLVEQGYREKVKPWDAFWGQRYSSVFDPDQNQIDIFADLKKE